MVKNLVSLQCVDMQLMICNLTTINKYKYKKIINKNKKYISSMCV